MIEVIGRRVRIEHANVVPAMKNFSGTKFGSNGNQRYFFITLDDEQAEVLSEMGYNITFYEKKEFNEDGDEVITRIPEIKLKLRFDMYPPDIKTYTGSWHGTEQVITEANVHNLDELRFLDCCVAFTPYNWTNNGKSGTSAYLKTMYVIIPEPDFAHLFIEED